MGQYLALICLIRGPSIPVYSLFCSYICPFSLIYVIKVLCTTTTIFMVAVVSTEFKTMIKKSIFFCCCFPQFQSPISMFPSLRSCLVITLNMKQGNARCFYKFPSMLDCPSLGIRQERNKQAGSELGQAQPKL